MFENRLGKYLLYAIGEIILVVIGILIALQINSWNDFRKDRESEQILLLNFKDNLSRDRELLENFHHGTEIGLKAVDTTLLIINGHIPFNFYSFSNNIEQILSNKYFQSSSSTFDQSIGAGNMDLIQNEKLRSRILNYYKLTKLNFEDNRVLETNQLYVFPTIFSMIVPTKTISSTITGIETNLPELDLASLGSNKEFNTWVIFKKTAFERQRRGYSNLKVEVEGLIEMIDSNLKESKIK